MPTSRLLVTTKVEGDAHTAPCPHQMAAARACTTGIKSGNVAAASDFTDSARFAAPTYIW
jgi:hypothetical protein